MPGIIYSLVAGIFIALQGVFNANVSAKLGVWQTNTIVNGSGFLICLIIFTFVRDGSLSDVAGVNKVYLLGGGFGVIIVWGVIQGITLIGPAYATSLIILSQLALALLINTVGLFGIARTPLTLTKLAGILLIAGGVIVFELK